MIRLLMTFVVVAMLFGYTELNAQSYRSELETFSQKVEQSQTFYTEMTVQVLAQSAEPVSQFDAIICKDHQEFAYILNDTEMYFSNHYTIWVSNDQRQVVFEKRSKKDSKKIQELMSVQLNLDSLLKEAGEITFLGEAKGQKGYQFHMETGPVEWVEYYFDTSTGFPSRAEYTYRESLEYPAQKVEIKFSNTTTDLQEVGLRPKLENYLREEKGELLPAQRLAGYEFEMVDNQ